MSGWLGTDFPWGTLTVNIVGSFLLALIVQVSLDSDAFSPAARIALTTGVMGGFTTYSTFNYQTFAYLQSNDWGLAILNVGVTVIACLAAGALGYGAARALAA
jgi:CrcB protein